MNTKIVAMYLPQYHRIPENDKWWGEGYTDWKAVQDAKPLFSGHNQPRIPVDDQYYDLSDVQEIRKQADLATQYGIYGFGIYHYWFSSKQKLLERPAELLLNDKSIKTHFFFMWDNGSWKRTWSNVKFSNSWAPMYEKNTGGPEILAELQYGDERDWKVHFDYLLPFFHDERYIRIDGKPLFGVFNQNNQPDTIKRMFRYWNQLAVENGLGGIVTLGKSNSYHVEITEFQFDYEPATHAWVGTNNLQKAIFRLYDNLRLKFGRVKTYDYEHVWKRIIKDFRKRSDYFPGAFVRYDDTPRRGKTSSIVTGESPLLFEKYLRELLKLSNENGKEFLFLTAWNEWGEGSYMEPDKTYGYSYLEALCNVLLRTDGDVRKE